MSKNKTPRLMKYVTKTSYGYRANVQSREEFGTSRNIGTFTTEHRANIAGMLYKYWQHHYPEDEIPRKPTSPDAIF